jgi:hypothetical protein
MAARSVILVLLAACAGPVPSVEHVAVAPSPLPGHVRITGTLINRGGTGTVELHLELRGKTTLRQDELVEVHPHEQLELAYDLAAPADTYTATIDAEYPN